MAYSTLLFDLDHTLLDSDGSEAAAFADTMRSVEVEPTDEIFDRYRAINKVLWSQVERGECTPGEVKVRRFEQLSAELGPSAIADGGVGGIAPHTNSGPGSVADAMAAVFADGLGRHGELYPGAQALLDQLAATGGVRMAMITNGLSEVQRARIDRLGLGSYFEAVIISAEVGWAKPGTEIFDLAFEQLGWPDRSGALMIGDSLTSDIQGGINYGIDTCWYNPAGPDSGRDRSPATHEVSDLKSVLGLI
jgi:FMN phosphatase YigB (HAD superfamily)